MSTEAGSGTLRVSFGGTSLDSAGRAHRLVLETPAKTPAKPQANPPKAPVKAPAPAEVVPVPAPARAPAPAEVVPVPSTVKAPAPAEVVLAPHAGAKSEGVGVEAVVLEGDEKHIERAIQAVAAHWDQLRGRQKEMVGKDFTQIVAHLSVMLTVVVQTVLEGSKVEVTSNLVAQLVVRGGMRVLKAHPDLEDNLTRSTRLSTGRLMNMVSDLVASALDGEMSLKGALKGVEAATLNAMDMNGDGEVTMDEITVFYTKAAQKTLDILDDHPEFTNGQRTIRALENVLETSLPLLQKLPAFQKDPETTEKALSMLVENTLQSVGLQDEYRVMAMMVLRRFIRSQMGQRISHAITESANCRGGWLGKCFGKKK